MLSLQLAYWKYITGHFYFYSYKGFGFSWLRPHVWNYLMSYRSGWLRFCPIFLVAPLGLYFIWKKNINRLAIISFLAINSYIVMAWDIWWYGGRAMIQSYPVLIFTMAALYEGISRYAFLKAILLTWVLAGIYINIWWTYQAHYGKVKITDSSRAYYWATLGRWSVNEETTKLLDTPDEHRDIQTESLKLIYTNDFEQDSSINKTLVGMNGASVKIDPGRPFTAEYTIPKDKIRGEWIRVKADFKTDLYQYEPWQMPQFVVRLYKRDEQIKSNTLRISRFLNPNEMRSLYFDTNLKGLNYDRVTVLVWNADSNATVEMDNLEVYDGK
jgi:hypothetical protein